MVVEKGLFKHILNGLGVALSGLVAIIFVLYTLMIVYFEYTSIDYYSNKLEVTELGQCIGGSSGKSECKAKSHGRMILSESPMVIGDVMQMECSINKLGNTSCDKYVVPYERGKVTEREAWDIYEHRKSN